MRPANAESKVDLPEPFDPMTPMASPRRVSKETPLTASMTRRPEPSLVAKR